MSTHDVLDAEQPSPSPYKQAERDWELVTTNRKSLRQLEDAATLRVAVPTQIRLKREFLQRDAARRAA